MIRFTQGNLLEAKAEALVNTVNTVGVMGKGIALMFKERFTEKLPTVRCCLQGWRSGDGQGSRDSGQRARGATLQRELPDQTALALTFADGLDNRRLTRSASLLD